MTGPKTFVVDDEAVIATTLAAILRLNGFDATAFTNPLEVLAKAKTDSPQLLVTDVAMPQMTGVELALQISKTVPSCGILLFSGHAATADLLRSAREDGHDFLLLAKPVHPSHLIDVLRRL